MGQRVGIQLSGSTYPDAYRALGLTPSITHTRVGVHAFNLKYRQKGQKFKVPFLYIYLQKWRLAWAT